MVPIERLQPGMKVWIVSEKTHLADWNEAGQMDHWLGQVMTVKRITRLGSSGKLIAKMEEDATERDGGWLWFDHMIEAIVDDPLEDALADFEPDTDISALFDSAAFEGVES